MRPRYRLGHDEKEALLVADLIGLPDVKFLSDRIQLNLPQQIYPTEIAKLLNVEWGLIIPIDFDAKRPTVVLIQDLESTAESVRNGARFVESKDIQFLLIEYPNDGSIAQSVMRLALVGRQVSVG